MFRACSCKCLEVFKWGVAENVSVLGQTLKIETYGLGFEKTYEFRSAQKTWPRSGGPRGDRQLSACSRRPSSGLGLLGLLVEEDPVRSPPKLTGTGVPFQADGVAPVLAGLDGLPRGPTA